MERTRHRPWQAKHGNQGEAGRGWQADLLGVTRPTTAEPIAEPTSEPTSKVSSWGEAGARGRAGCSVTSSTFLTASSKPLARGLS